MIKFPISKDILDASSCFDLVNLVNWEYSLSPIMVPFRGLIKWNSHFACNQFLDNAFRQSKQVIVGLLKKKKRSYNFCNKANNLICLRLVQRKHVFSAARKHSLRSVVLRAGTSYLQTVDFALRRSAGIHTPRVKLLQSSGH